MTTARLNIWVRNSFSCFLHWRREGVCLRHREREKYTPFSSSAPSPSSPLPHDSSLESVCLCVCMCVILLPWGVRLSLRGVHWLSHSYVRIRRIHLHFLTATHSIFRHTCVMFWSPGHNTEEMRSFWWLCFLFSLKFFLNFSSFQISSILAFNMWLEILFACRIKCSKPHCHTMNGPHGHKDSSQNNTSLYSWHLIFHKLYITATAAD